MLELIIVVLFGIAGAILLQIITPLFLSRLAAKDVWWSPYRKKPNDGQYIVYTRGKDAGGPFDSIIESIKGWKYVPDTHLFIEDKSSTSKDGGYLSDQLGIAYVGFFKRIYSRERTYTTFNTTNKEFEKKEMKDEEARIFYFQTNLAVVVKGAETSVEFAEIDLIVTFSMRTIDPNLAEFVTGKPEKVISDIILARTRAYVNEKTYEGILAESGDMSGSGLVQYIMETNDDIRSRHGVEIFAPYIAEVSLGAGQEKFREASQLEGIKQAEQKAIKVQAENDVIKAKGEAEATRIRYGAIANSMPGSAGVAVAIAEAQRDAVIQNQKATTLVFGSAPIAINPDKEE